MAKVTIVGGGNVGAMTALYVSEKEVADVVLLDVVEGLPQGKALDMFEGTPVRGVDTRIRGSNDFEELRGSDVVVVTAGLARKPGMSRTDLLLKNAEIITSISEKTRIYAPHAFVVMVTNPLDVMSFLAWRRTGFPRNRVMGMAGVLDSTRFRSFIAMELNVSVTDVTAMVLGGHGDAMVPLTRFTNVGGIPVSELIPADRLEKMVQRTRDGGAEIVSLLKSGSAYYAPAASAAQMVEAILKNKRRILPASVLLDGEYGFKGVFLGVPIKLGATGVEEIIEVSLTEEERDALARSARGVEEAIKELNL